ncbi:MAG: hypothetical protein Sapg2KO_45770 [Saprospiraceae bacterium]
MAVPKLKTNFQALRNQYPALEEGTYFNTCSSGLFSKEVLAFRRQLDEDYMLMGSNFRAGVYKNIRGVKETIAQAFGANPDRTALVPSCSHGLNLILEGLAQGQRVLHLQEDYPSIVWPFESRDFVCHSIPEGVYSEEELGSFIRKHQIDVLAVSAVQYSNGAIIAPANFKALKAEFPDLIIIVDGTQFLGTAPFNFADSGIDVFAASAFKWLCAGYGNGVVFLSERMESILASKVRGYNTFKNPRKEGQPTLGEYFEPGHQDLLAFKTLAFQVNRFNELGFDQIQAQIHQLNSLVRQGVEAETNYSIRTPLNPHLESGILSIDAPKTVVSYLNQNGIVCSYNRGLRLGIHFYNNEADIKHLLTLLKSLNV